MFRVSGNSSSKGFGVVELMVSLGIFSVLSLLLFALFSKGVEAILSANAQQQAELSLNKTHFWLKRDLEQARPGQVRQKRVPSPGNGDAVWFLTAEDPLETNVDQKYKRELGSGSPLPQANILYYLIRPTDYANVSGGISAAVDPDPLNDFFAPHKFLVRKVIDRTPDPDDRESLLTNAEVDSYLTPPNDYTLQPFPTEANVVEYRLVADKMLSFQVLIDQSVVEVQTSALRIDEARKKMPLGNASLKSSPLTSHREARFVLHK